MLGKWSQGKKVLYTLTAEFSLKCVFVASTRVFVREATGLVREFSPFQLILFNFLTAPIVPTLMFSVNWNPNLFPGFDFNTGLLIITLLAIPMYLTYAVVYAAFPKAGTDYVFQSRVLNPGIGFASTFASWVFFQFWFIALEGTSVVEMFLVPWLFSLSQFTGNTAYAGIATALSQPSSLAILSFAAVIAAGLIVMGGLRYYVKIQTFLFVCAVVAFFAMIIMMASTPSSAFVSNLNTQLSTMIGSSDAYNKVISTAQSKSYVLSPPFTLYASIGAMITPWTFALAWTMFGNLGMGGEVKSAGTVKTQMITILGSFFLVVAGLFVLWNLFIGMVGQTFWNAIATLAWNGDPLLTNLPSFFYTQPASYIFLYGTNNIVLGSIWAVGGALTLIATIFTIYTLVTRMVFAHTFDRLFPEKLAYVNERTRTPIYIMVCMIILACAWTYGVLYYSSILYTYLASVEFMISATIILTMIGAIAFPFKMKRYFEQSPAKRYRTALIPLALIGAFVNFLVLYYLWTVPALLAATPQSESLIVGVFVVALIYYFVIKAYRKSKGLDLGLAFKEIPPD